MRERDVEAYLVKRCKQEGILCWKWSSPGRRGVPDRLLLYRGEWFAVEVKAPGKRPTVLQQRELRNIVDAGGQGWWVDSEDEVEHLILCIRCGLPLVLEEKE